MTAPHVDLGNSFQDAGSGANSFAAGLVGQQMRQRQIAMQEALAQSQGQHLDAETNTLIPAQAGEATARAGVANAQATGLSLENQPADEDDYQRHLAVDPSAPPGSLNGMTKAAAQQFTQHMSTVKAMSLQREQMMSFREQSLGLREQGMDMRGGQNFMSQQKSLLETEPFYASFKGAITQAASANPAERQAAYKSVFTNWQRLADPGQRSSIQMLQYIQQINPSLIGRFNLTAQKLETGDFPPEVLDAMTRHVLEQQKNRMGVYEGRRTGVLQAQPALEHFIPPTNVAFPLSFPDVNGMAPAASTPAGPRFLPSVYPGGN
jgi:hypothetical protein